MNSSTKQLVKQLKEDGQKLLKPPSCVEDLLNLLMKVNFHLARVLSKPLKSTKDALQPLMKALVTEELLLHPDKHVKIYITSCFCEVLRITAPEPPYNSEVMEIIFRQIVAAFEDLPHLSSISYQAVIKILMAFSKARLFKVMMNLECDALIAKVFELFLSNIRPYHSPDLFSYMETIMCSILNESKEISSEILSALLNSVRNGNRCVLPLSFKLGEKVLTNCANKFNPDLLQAVVLLGIDLENYAQIVTSICQDAFHTLNLDYVSHSGENPASGTLREKLIQVWAPKNKRFNDGVIEHFDHVRKRLKELNHEGDEEMLILSKERWKLVNNVHLPDKIFV